MTAEFDDFDAPTAPPLEDAARSGDDPFSEPLAAASDARTGGDPFSAPLAAASGWIADAETARRAGRAEEARRLAEAGLVDEPYEATGRAVLALACLDLGDAAGARRALEGALVRLTAAAPEALALDDSADEPFQVLSDPLADLAENELERAFDHAESEHVEAWTTNRVAEVALEAVEEGEPEGVGLEAPASPFATETVADLYERQGDAERARAIRRSLRGAPPGGAEDRTRWVNTLERWLDNLRRASR